MPAGPTFCQCGRQLEPGASACGQCGKLVGAQNPGRFLAIFLCVLGGAVLGISAAIAATFLVAQPTGGNTCSGNVLGIAIGATLMLGVIGLFVFGTRVSRQKPQVAALLMSGAIAFLCPFTPCFLTIFSTMPNCRH